MKSIIVLHGAIGSKDQLTPLIDAFHPVEKVDIAQLREAIKAYCG